MTVDRSEKHRFERLAKMVKLPSNECRSGNHADCSGNRTIVVGEIDRTPVDDARGRGYSFRPDTIGSPCSCPCHKDPDVTPRS